MNVFDSVVPAVQRYRRDEYVETPQGTKFAHAALFFGSANIMLGSKTLVEPDALIRGVLVCVGERNFVVACLLRSA
jgi:hypothetical protein